MASHDACLREVTKLLRSLPRQIPEGTAEAYIGGGQSERNYFGLKMPTIDKVMKKGFSFSETDPALQARIWDHIWKSSNDYEVMLLALEWFGDKKRRASLPEHWGLLRYWVERIDNWAHADGLASLYAVILERDPSRVLRTLDEWSESRNPWKRRLSLTSLIYYRSQRERLLPPGRLFPMVRKQLDHEFMYVQKGVGWTLRELWNAYPDHALSFIERHLHELSAIAFSAATEKMPKGTKERLKKLRAEARKAKSDSSPRKRAKSSKKS